MKWIVALILIFLLAYVLIRPWLKVQPWAAGFFSWIEPIEIKLFKNSTTILFARLKVLSGILLTTLTTLGSVNLATILPVLPEKHRGIAEAIINLMPLALSVVGLMDERLRNVTTQPIEIVALPDTKPLPIKVAAAVDLANVSRIAAIESVKTEEKKQS